MEYAFLVGRWFDSWGGSASSLEEMFGPLAEPENLRIAAIAIGIVAIVYLVRRRRRRR